ncbi:MAG: type II toxin-antitoxin system VapC family toxin [Ferruginibacter sp.]|nr:type II toxin-antitoxin system VapC family toxin [Rhodoferax sp.]
MIGLDTNVLVRYIMQDHPLQSPKASALIDALDGAETGFITLVSVVELVWVLSFSYGLSRTQVAAALDAMVRTKQFKIEAADQVVRALRVFKAGKADFADCLIERSAAQAGCLCTMTFDAGAAKHAGMTLVT